MRILVWSFLLILLASPAPARTFTNRDGRAIDGEILGIDGKMVNLNVNGKSFAVPIENFIQSDQVYIRSWVGKKADSRFEFRAGIIEEAGSRVSKRDGDEKIVESKQNYEIRIVNRSGTDVGPLSVKYNIITQWLKTSKETDKAGVGKKTAFGSEPGTHELQGLTNGEEAVLSTGPVLVKSREWKVRYTVFNSSSQASGSQWDDYTEKLSLEGIWVRVFSGEEMIAEWRDSGASRDDLKWSDAQVIADADAAILASPTETHEDLEPIPPVPESLRDDRNARDLHLQVMNAASEYSNMAYKEAKAGDLRDQKKLFKSLLDRYKLAIGSGQ